MNTRKERKAGLGQVWLLIALFAFGTDNGVAQQRRTIEPRDARVAHNATAAIGGPTHGVGGRELGSRFPIIPAGVLVAKNSSGLRPAPSVTLAKDVGGTIKPTAPKALGAPTAVSAAAQTGAVRPRQHSTAAASVKR